MRSDEVADKPTTLARQETDMHVRILVIATIVLGSTLAWADTIEEKRMKEAAEQDSAKQIKHMNEKCKTSVSETGYIDWSSWKALKSEDGRNKVAHACRWVPYGIGALCRSDKIAQEMVAKNIKKMVCKGDATDDVQFEMKGNTLVVHTLLGAQGTEKKARSWLTKNLE
jgi:hypothetical protein